MRANRKFLNNEKAEVGIGTMIVFIATVLVAAIAAGVLIDVSGKLQERSSRTGKEATETVSGNLVVVSIVGLRDDATPDDIITLDVYLQVAPGAPKMDLDKMRVGFNSPDGYVIWEHHATNQSNGAANTYNFTLTASRDADGSFANQVANGGDYIQMTLDLDNAVLELGERTEVLLTLIPEFGNVIEVGFLTPPSFGIQTKILLK